MINDTSIWEAENVYLGKVIDEIQTQLDNSINTAGNFKRETIEIQKKMWEEVKSRPTGLSDLDGPAQAWQYQTEISNQARKYRFSYDMIIRLEKMLKSPYFGRIDFREDDETDAEQIYIGICSLNTGDRTGILVYDWRAPVSSMFYDYETGPSSYVCPMGVINGRMLLKRQFKIENRRIVYMFDSSLRINDEMLQEMLGRSTDSRMRTIVTSIQKEQNRIIRAEQDKILIVQGPAGSGKTSIALHRAAYLLYRYRENIKSENILIFSPNHVFEDYISSVLPELGEENVSRSTFADFFKDMLGQKYRLETMNEQMEYILSGRAEAIRLESIKFKASAVLMQIMREYVKHLENGGSIEFRSLIYKGELIVSSDEAGRLFKEDYSFIPYIKRLQKLKQRLLYLIEPYEKALAEEILKNELAEDVSLDENEKRVMSVLKAKTVFKPILDDIDAMTSFDIAAVYADLYRGMDIYIGGGETPDVKAACKADNADKAENTDYDINSISLSDICTYTIRHLEKGIISYEDLVPVIFLLTALGAEDEAKAIKHVIIDEAQDYTVIQYEIIRRVFGHCNMTILGDLNQSVNVYMNIGSFDKAADILGVKDTANITLSKSYRSTKEIADFCNALLLSGSNAEQLERSGNKPLIIYSEKERLGKRVADDIAALKEKGHKLIAVICKTAGQCDTLYESIRAFAQISLITNRNEEYRGGAVVIPSYLAKGLEFDAVLVCSADGRNYRGEEDRRLLYTVCTRALHELYLYYYDELSYLIKNMSADLYHALF